jgi:hypothetical protein
MQAIGIIWQQNVAEYDNPEVARTLVSNAWWQVG